MGFSDYCRANRETLKTLVAGVGFLVTCVLVSLLLPPLVMSMPVRPKVKTLKVAVVLSESIEERAGAYAVEIAAQKDKPIREVVPYDNLTAANKFLRDFPSVIPGARAVRKYETPGAGKCLVHVLQRHYVNPDSSRFEHYKRVYRKVNQVQHDIYDILSYLRSHHGLYEVIVEGAWEGMTDQDLVYYYHAVLNSLRAHGYISQGLGTEQCRYIPGAALLLFKEGKIRLVPSRKGFSQRGDIHEDYIVAKASTRDACYSVVVLGAAHIFGGLASCGAGYPQYRVRPKIDNIAIWNEANPDKTFSLIEVVPRSYHHGVPYPLRPPRPLPMF